MTKGLLAILATLAATFAAVTPVRAQSSFTFSYSLADGNVHALGAGTAITYPSVDVNATTTATVIISNGGPSAGTISGITVTGAGFRLANPNLLPATVGAGQNLVFGMVFAPTQPGSFTGSFTIFLPGSSISGTLAGSTPAPNITLNYVDPATNNILPLANNATLSFPNTQVGATTTITVVAANTGAGTGSVSAISLSGSSSGFQIVSLAPLPISVAPSQQLTFGIRFTPVQQQISTDVLTMVVNGQTTTVNLKAQGIQAIYSYQFTSGAGTLTAGSGGAVTIPNTAVGQTTTYTVSVSNTGLSAGQVSTINVTGQGLSLSNLPNLPLTLQPNASTQFTLIFSPTQPGAVTGRLTFGTDTVTITSTAAGPQLTYTYTSGSSVIPITAGGAILFTPLAVGNTESLTFSIQNTGTSAATISSINLAAPSTIFGLPGLPGLPATLNAGASITFPISFTPNNVGNLTATLMVNSVNFPLSGTGTQPPSLPAYSFVGPSGNQQPAQQPTVGLTLASAYPLALQGTLTLTFNSNVFTDDSSIEFANGMRTVPFTIPANTTQALFSGNVTGVALQTGTTSGNILLTPSFTIPGGFNLTPTSPTLLTLTIQRLAPQLLNASMGSVTTTGFTVTLSGYTTSRVLSHLDVQLTPKSGQNFSSTHLTIDVSSAAASWFQGTAAAGYGGSFLVAIPFVLSSGNSNTTNLVQQLQSLSITATNDVGTSNAIVVAIP